MTANQLSYQKNLESERANRVNEQIQRERLALDLYLGELNAQQKELDRQNQLNMTYATNASKERVEYFNRQNQWEMQGQRIEKVDKPEIAINQMNADTQRARTWVDFVGNIVGGIAKGGFLSLFGV